MKNIDKEREKCSVRFYIAATGAADICRSRLEKATDRLNLSHSKLHFTRAFLPLPALQFDPVEGVRELVGGGHEFVE